ncbi:AAA family ATPase [Desulfovirgula thermocuniculi]|uniref:AAA family ATPase n=1 Tax=Desulfovirgula thermocuniculi TaxID=348842 RepID=UPI00040AAE95|nr:AAA family ATPase [Desulfovirgula thermocuniculi]
MEQPRARFDPETFLDRLSAKWPNWPRWAGFVGGALAGSLLHKKGFPLALTYAVWLGLTLAGWWVSRQGQAAGHVAGEEGATTAAPPPPSQSRPRRRSPEEVWREIDSLVGLAEVKEKLREVAAVVRANRERRRMGLPPLKQSLHMMFTGNPGTGKTTIARLVGELFAALGVLPSGHLVEVDRGKLTGVYRGEPAKFTEEAVKRALGGVLFIDEAYALAKKDWYGYDTQGSEVLSTLVKLMEDYRDRVCVILAGYTEPTRELFKVNPGLESRIAFTIEFPDYSPEELLAIARLEARKQNFHLAPGAEDWLLEHFYFVQPRIGELGNGRYARKLVEEAIRRAVMAGRPAGELRAEDFLE